jgi:hypothetical protein
MRCPTVQELRDRLDKIRQDESQAEITRDERKHGEMIALARRSRIASVLSVSAAVVSAGAAAVSAYFVYSDHSHGSAAKIAQPTALPAPPSASPKADAR